MFLGELGNAGIQLVDMADGSGNGFEDLRGLYRALDTCLGFFAIGGHDAEHAVGAVLQAQDDVLNFGGGRSGF